MIEDPPEFPVGPDPPARPRAALPQTDQTVTSAVPSTAPHTIGAYRIIRTLGEGGMGVVYEATQQHPKRTVALKVIRGGPSVDESQVRLFQREAQTLASLKHRSIAAIYELGRTEMGQHFFAMELVRGETLDQYLKSQLQDGRLTETALKLLCLLFCRICEAVNYAHQRGVIHRDLKPSNILVMRESSTSSGSSFSLVEARSKLIAIRNGLLLALAFAAGYIDALSYLGLSRVFTANMTGNTVLLGLALAQLDGNAAARSGFALAGFLAGAAVGARIVAREDSHSLWPRAVLLALTLESLILLAFAAGWHMAHDALPTATTTAVLIVLSALAMGVQSAAVNRLEISGIATTYLTGTLTALAGRLMVRSRRKRTVRFGHSPLLAAVWIVYIGGAVVAAVDLPRHPVLALVLPAALIIVVVIIAAVSFRPR